MCTPNCYCPIYCTDWEPTYVSLDWLEAWLGAIELEEAVIVLQWWACMVVLFFKNVSPSLLSSSKTSPKHCWDSFPMQGPTCTTNCYCLNNCNHFAMSSLGIHLCSPWLTCSMSRSDGAKESCDCSLLMSLCGCILQQLFLMSLEL